MGFHLAATEGPFLLQMVQLPLAWAALGELKDNQQSVLAAAWKPSQELGLLHFYRCHRHSHLVCPGATAAPEPASLLFSPADVLILLVPSAELHPTGGQELARHLSAAFEGSSDAHPPRGLLTRACSLLRWSTALKPPPELSRQCSHGRSFSKRRESKLGSDLVKAAGEEDAGGRWERAGALQAL